MPDPGSSNALAAASRPAAAKPRENRAETLALAVEDAAWITEYASRGGIELPPADLAILVNAEELLKSGGLVGDEQVKFWQALQRAAAKVGPNTLESWRHIYTDTEDTFLPVRLYRQIMGRSTKVSFAFSIVLTYRFFTLLALFILLAVQVYWIVGWNIASDIRRLESPLVQAAAPAGSAAATDAAGAAEAPVVKPRRVLTDSEEARLEGDYAILRTWNNVWRHPLGSLWSWLFGAGDEAERAGVPSRDALVFAGSNQIELAKASIVLLSLSSYLLPLLYGWIGALAYTLRSLESEIRRVALRRVSRVSYGLRATLGMLAGLAIGWFLRPDDDGGLGSVVLPELGGDFPISSISAVALAFVAGYSVDLLFAALDRIVGAFGGRMPDRDAPKPAADQ